MPGFYKCFLGGDCAPSESKRSDEGSLMIGIAHPRTPFRLTAKGRYSEDDDERRFEISDNLADWYFDFAYCRVFGSKEKLSARQWSGFIHGLDERFGFSKIVLDPGGGGVYVKRELMEQEQIISGVKRKVVPLCDQVDGPKKVVRGRFIVHLFKRGDPGVEEVWPDPEDKNKSKAGDELLKDALFSDFKDGCDSGLFGWPRPFEEVISTDREQWARLPEERQWAWKNLTAGTKQLNNINVVKKEDGTYLFTGRGAHQFISSGRDDIALSKMYCYAGFRMWLRTDAWKLGLDAEDEDGFSGG